MSGESATEEAVMDGKQSRQSAAAGAAVALGLLVTLGASAGMDQSVTIQTF